MAVFLGWIGTWLTTISMTWGATTGGSLINTNTTTSFFADCYLVRQVLVKAVPKFVCSIRLRAMLLRLRNQKLVNGTVELPGVQIANKSPLLSSPDRDANFG